VARLSTKKKSPARAGTAGSLKIWPLWKMVCAVAAVFLAAGLWYFGDLFDALGFLTGAFLLQRYWRLWVDPQKRGYRTCLFMITLAYLMGVVFQLKRIYPMPFPEDHSAEYMFLAWAAYFLLGLGTLWVTWRQWRGLLFVLVLMNIPIAMVPPYALRQVAGYNLASPAKAGLFTKINWDRAYALTTDGDVMVYRRNGVFYQWDHDQAMACGADWDQEFNIPIPLWLLLEML